MKDKIKISKNKAEQKKNYSVLLKNEFKKLKNKFSRYAFLKSDIIIFKNFIYDLEKEILEDPNLLTEIKKIFLVIKIIEIYIFQKTEFFEVIDLLIKKFVDLIEKDPFYDYFAKLILLKKIYFKIFAKFSLTKKEYNNFFVKNIKLLIKKKFLNSKILNFDLEKISAFLLPEKDKLFNYIGLKTLNSRYLLKKGLKMYETPQFFWMRIAMGLAINETGKEKKTVDFYHVMSNFCFIPSTPTLFHSGLIKKKAQLSSCFLTTTKDDLNNIFKNLKDIANLLKHSGGVAFDWTNLRAVGSIVKSTGIESTGIIPFLKLANDTTISINRSGRRRGASVVYLEIWHLEIESFLDLRKNVGDESLRTHELNLATWIPDLFMKRVRLKEDWTLFSPSIAPDLHSIYGKKFEERYCHYEKIFSDLEIKVKMLEKEVTLEKTYKKRNLTRNKIYAIKERLRLVKKIPALNLWRMIITRLFETGFPWITFKDSCNIRSPQDHVGVVNSSNLCTEITLNTSKKETAVCNLGSINLSTHFKNKKLDKKMLKETIKVAVRMLDNVIDLTFYPTKEAKFSNKQHRPIGLGMMGFQDLLFKMDTSYHSEKALIINNEITEWFSYNAIKASINLAKERGTYKTFKGSKWDRGIFPFETIKLLAKERGFKIKLKQQQTLDWNKLRTKLRKYGLRNSNIMAIAPTATISNIVGCYPCIEPMFSNIFVEENVSGEFTIINNYLVEDLKKINLWDRTMLDDIKYFEGSIQKIERIPHFLKEKYQGVYEIDPMWIVKMAAYRGQWIDQSISHNIFFNGLLGNKLSKVYFSAWERGLKTTYYLRTLGASRIESSTLDAKKYGFTQQRNQTLSNKNEKLKQTKKQPKSCLLKNKNDNCESCQ